MARITSTGDSRGSAALLSGPESHCNAPRQRSVRRFRRNVGCETEADAGQKRCVEECGKPVIDPNSVRPLYQTVLSLRDQAIKQVAGKFSVLIRSPSSQTMGVIGQCCRLARDDAARDCPLGANLLGLSGFTWLFLSSTAARGIGTRWSLGVYRSPAHDSPPGLQRVLVTSVTFVKQTVSRSGVAGRPPAGKRSAAL